MFNKYFIIIINSLYPKEISIENIKDFVSKHYSTPKIKNINNKYNFPVKKEKKRPIPISARKKPLYENCQVYIFLFYFCVY